MATFKPTLFAVALALLVVVSSAAPNNQKPSSELSLKIPEECIGKGFCYIKPEGYDDMQDLIDRLLTPTFIAENLGDRSGDTPAEELSPESEWDNCPTRTKVMDTIYAYSSSNGSDSDYIIQHKLLMQPVTMTTCALDKIKDDQSDSNPDQQCFRGLGLFNKKTTCVTTKTKRSLFVLDVKTEKIITKPYDIDCCCHCMVQNT